MPPRNTKRAPPPKNRGKANTLTKTNANSHPQGVKNDAGNRAPTSTHTDAGSAHRGRHALPRPPPARLSKMWTSHHQMPPVRAVATHRTGIDTPSVEATPATRGEGAATTTAPSQGFAYLSPDVMAAVRGAPSSCSSTTPSQLPAAPSPAPPQGQTQQQTQQQRTSPPISSLASQPLSMAESSLARLRALAGAPSLLLSPGTSPAHATLLKNEESPLQPSPSRASASSSAPSSPYTPDLLRRLAALNGTPFPPVLATVHVDRLKHHRDAPQSLSSDELDALNYNEEEEPQQQQTRVCFPHWQRFASATPAHEPTASATGACRKPSRSIDLENEEESSNSVTHQPPFSPTEMPTTMVKMSRLDRLRAAGRAESSLPTSPVSAPLSAPALRTSPASDTPAAASSLSAAAPSQSGADRLLLLRQRASASPASQPLGRDASPSTTTTSASTAADAMFPSGYYMNLERMQIGHGSTPTTDTTSASAINASNDLDKKRAEEANRPLRNTLASWMLQSNLSQAPPYALLSRARDDSSSNTNTNNNNNNSCSGCDASAFAPMNPRLLQPPKPIDDALQEADEVTRLDAHLQRYRNAAAQSLLSPSQLGSGNATATTANTSSAVGAAHASSPTPQPKRAVRRSQRRQAATAAKKESAVATLVKGRKSAQQLSSHPAALLASAQKMDQLRSRTSPVPVGEGEASTLPPSWSASSPFASHASPHLYGMLHNAARVHADDRQDGVGREERAGGASFLASSATLPDLRRLPAFSSSRSPRDRPLPVSSQCVVFDTSSLLDAEPGVLNLLLERAHIGIPFKVLDELDFMHKAAGAEHFTGAGPPRAGVRNAGTAVGNNNNGGGTAAGGVSGTHDREWRRKRAHDLRNWIAACVGKSNNRLLLQKRTDVVEEYDRHTTNNDDQILGYAVFLRRHREKVVFVTEDKFLRIKAAAEIGRAYSYNEIRQMVGMPKTQGTLAVAAARRFQRKK